MNEAIVKNLSLALGSGFKEASQYEMKVQIASAEEAAKYLVGKKRVLILTGAGLSAASGIPTFRGQDGFWKTRKRYGGEADPTEICTKTFFEKNP